MAHTKDAPGRPPNSINISLDRRQPSPADLKAFEAGQALTPRRGSSVAFDGSLRFEVDVEAERIVGVRLRAGFPADLLIDANQNEILAKQWVDTELRSVASKQPAVKVRSSDLDDAVSKVVDAAIVEIAKGLDQSGPLQLGPPFHARRKRATVDASGRRLKFVTHPHATSGSPV